MKKKLFYLVFLLGIQQLTHAQAVNWDTALSQIKTPTSGFSSQKILLDKVASFANLYNYNDTDYNTSNQNHFKQSLSELYRASDAQYFSSAENYTLFETTIANAAVIPIGIINTKCTYLNYDEENQSNGNLQLINGVFQPIKTTEPYFIEKEICIVSPLLPSFAAENNTFTFSFNSQQIYQYGNTIQSLEADFGDGVWRSVIQNSIMVQGAHTITLDVTGVVKQKISFRITQQSGKQITTYSEIVLSNKIQKASTARYGSCAVSSLLKHRSTIADAQTVKGEIEYKVYYGDLNTSCKVKKPIIIVDGFDPGDKRRIEYKDCKLDPKCTDANEGSDFTEEKYKSLFKLMEYKVGTTPTSLIDKMTKENYDVILVNFPYYQKILNDLNSGLICGGADDIIRNGYSTASFIQKINNDLITNGSTEKLVVVGPSMGGLITKFALAYLEKQGIAHNTKLWVSMDSPHQGANIPLAIQQDIFFLGKKLKNADADSQFNDLLHSKAAEQLLIDIVDYDGNSVKNTVNSSFLSTLKSNGVANSNGFPVLGGIRKIAISNGSFAGTKNITPKENFLDIKASVKIKLLGIRVGRKRIFRINSYYTPNIGESITLVNNQGRNPEQNVDDTNYSKTYIGYNPNGSMDAVPGGNTNASNDLKNKVNASLETTDGWSNQFISIITTSSSLIIDNVIPADKNTILTPQSFIPTHSSLDTKGFSDWYQPLDKNLVCTGQTPFNSFYGENTNSGHITFTDNMVKWLLEELKGNNQAPSFPVNPSELSGTDKLCLGQTSTYSFADICKIPSAVNWSVSSNLQIISSTATSIVIKGLTSGQSVVTATFQNGMKITKTIGIYAATLPPVPSGSFSTPIVDCYSDGLIPITFYPSTSVYVDITYTPTLLAHPLQSQTRSITVKYTNPCTGAFTSKVLEFNYQAPNCLNALRTSATIYKVYPNPSTSIINVSLVDEALKPLTTKEIEAELYDLSGQPKQKVKLKDNSASINVEGLQKGIYILNIFIDGKTEGHQVIIE